MTQKSRKRRGREVHGILLLDKPTGMSSNAALQRVKRVFDAQKAGHTGALDPLATGMLPVCLGEATKYSQFLLDADKVYDVRAKLGVRTTTSDADGEPVSDRPVTITQADIEQALPQFRGSIEQVPSMFSALKYQGRPLYEYARKGEEVPRKARPIEIYSLEIRAIDLEAHTLDLRVHCSKGTYIRTLVDDLGEVLGCGAHVELLRRIAVADYPFERMLTLEQLKAMEGDLSALDTHLLPMDTAVKRLPELVITPEQARTLLHGKTVTFDRAPFLETTLVRVTACHDTHTAFIGVGQCDGAGNLVSKRMVQTGNL